MKIELIKKLDEVLFMCKNQIEWHINGCYGNGEEMVEKRNFSIAKRAIKKLTSARL